MDKYITGTMIKELREQKKMTQAELADALCVSDKTVSKWETGRGYPDISLLEPIAAVFGISLPELLSGSAVRNRNVSGNLLRGMFYVCPVCGNILHSMGQAVIYCHGIQLTPAEPETPDEAHAARIQRVEDEYYVEIDHEMTKQHYISMMAAVSTDRMELVKLYPEGSAQTRFPIRGMRKLYFYCNRDGLFCQPLKENIPRTQE